MKNLMNNITVSEIEISYKSKIKASERQKLTCSADSYNIFKSLSDFDKNIEYKEICYCLFLNNANKVLSVQKLSEGGLNSSIIDLFFCSRR